MQIKINWKVEPKNVCNCRNTELEVQLTATQKEGRMEQEQVNKLEHHLQEVGIFKWYICSIFLLVYSKQLDCLFKIILFKILCISATSTT